MTPRRDESAFRTIDVVWKTIFSFFTPISSLFLLASADCQEREPASEGAGREDEGVRQPAQVHAGVRRRGQGDDKSQAQAQGPVIWMLVCTVQALTNLRLLMFMLTAWVMGIGIGLIFTFLFWHLQVASITFINVKYFLQSIKKYFLLSRTTEATQPFSASPRWSITSLRWAPTSTASRSSPSTGTSRCWWWGCSGTSSGSSTSPSSPGPGSCYPSSFSKVKDFFKKYFQRKNILPYTWKIFWVSK